MPYTPEQQRLILQNAGYNPDEHEVFEQPNGKVSVFKKQALTTLEQPTTNPSGFNLKQEQAKNQPKFTTAQTVYETAKESLLPTAGGLAAGSYAALRLAAMNPTPVGWVAKGASLLAPLVAGAAGSLGTASVQGMFESQERKEMLGQMRTDRPVTTAAADFIPSLVAMNPAQGVRNIPVMGKALMRPFASKVLGESGQLAAPLTTAALQPAEKAILLNAGINMGTTAGFDAYEQSQSPDEFNPKQFAAKVLLSSVLNDPNKTIGQKVFKMPSTAMPVSEAEIMARMGAKAKAQEAEVKPKFEARVVGEDIKVKKTRQEDFLRSQQELDAAQDTLLEQQTHKNWKDAQLVKQKAAELEAERLAAQEIVKGGVVSKETPINPQAKVPTVPVNVPQLNKIVKTRQGPRQDNTEVGPATVEDILNRQSRIQRNVEADLPLTDSELLAQQVEEDYISGKRRQENTQEPIIDKDIVPIEQLQQEQIELANKRGNIVKQDLSKDFAGEIDLDKKEITFGAKQGRDTGYHEPLHGFLNELKNSPKQSDKELAARLIGSEEEATVEKGGLRLLNQRRAVANDPSFKYKFRQWYNSLKESAKVKMGFANDEEALNHALVRMQTDAPDLTSIFDLGANARVKGVSGEMERDNLGQGKLQNDSKERINQLEAFEDKRNLTVQEEDELRVLRLQERKPFDKMREAVKNQENSTEQIDEDLTTVAKNKQTDTPEFKKWFGDSKVVDSEGKPLVVYHGSGNDIKNFIPRGGEHGWFSENPDVASRYADQNKGNITPVFLSIKNPAKASYINRYGASFAKKMGYDGVIYEEANNNYYTTFSPEQIKSAIGNKGTFDPKNSDIRYQDKSSEPVAEVKPLVNQTPDSTRESYIKYLTPQYDKVSARVDSELGEAFKLAETLKGQNLGKYKNVNLAEFAKYNKEDLNKAATYRIEMLDNKGESDIKLTPKQEEISNLMSELIFDPIRDQQIKQKMDIQGREAGRNPFYFPQTFKPEVLAAWKRSSGTESNAYKEQMIQHLVANDVPLVTATEKVNKYINAIRGKSDSTTEFNALRKAAGKGIPEALRDPDAFKVMSNYIDRASRDLAFHKAIESSPDMKAKYDQFKTDPTVKDALDKYQGVQPENTSTLDQHVKVATKLFNNSILGGVTGLIDLVSTPQNVAPYLRNLTDYSAVVKSLFNLKQAAKESLATNARQQNLDVRQWGEIVNPDGWTMAADKLANLFRKYQGRELGDQSGKIWAYAIGKELASTKLLQAKAGDKNALDFIKKFGRGLDTDKLLVGDLDVNSGLMQIAKNFTDRATGTYGGMGLPADLDKGMLAPFMSLSKWGIEKSNVVFEDVVKPMKEGNFMPFLSYTLSGILTAEGIRELREFINGKKDRNPTVKEAFTSENKEQQIASIINLAQQGSYAGWISDIAKIGMDTYQGDMPRGFSFPLLDFASEGLVKGLKDFSEAVDNGQPKGEAIFGLTQQLITQAVQNARIAANHTINKDDIQDTNKMRDKRVFEKLSGQVDTTPEVSSNKLLNPDIREFKKTRDVDKAANELLPKIVDRLVAQAGDNPEKLKKLLKGLKTNNYQTFPSLDTSSIEAQAYYDFLVKTQGKQEADARLEDYLEKNQINRVKSEMVPSL